MLPALASILIPSHNSERWIGETLRSALGQTYSPVEVIVVDDGSSDRTREVVQKLADHRVKMVPQDAQGASAARNRALQHSNGEYIQWLDSDDVLDRNKVAEQIKALHAASSSRTMASARHSNFFYRIDRSWCRPDLLWASASPIEFLITSFEHNLWMGTPAWLMSRELAEAAGPWDTSLNMDDDGEYFCRAILASRGIAFVDSAHVYYRRRGNSLSHFGVSDAKMASQWRALELQIRHLLKAEDSARTRRAALAHLRHHLSCFYPERPDVVEQMRNLAIELGGQLEPARANGKYGHIERIFGPKAAKMSQIRYNNIKFALLRAIDRLSLFLSRKASKAA